MNPSLETIVAPSAVEILGLEETDIPGFTRSVLDEHARLLRQRSSGIRKDAAESAVTIVESGHRFAICVKEFRWRGMGHALKGLVRPTQGIRTFRNGWKLHERGIGAALPLALVRSKSTGLVRVEWIIMEVIPGGLELDRYILKRAQAPWRSPDRRSLSRMFGRFIGSMHAKGVFHSDLKTCNIVVSESQYSAGKGPSELVSQGGGDLPIRGPGSRQSHALPTTRAASAGNDASSVQTSGGPVSFYLLDYDEVRFSGDISLKKRVKNLVQLFLSTPAVIGATDRLCFLREYALHAGLSRKERRSLCRRIIEASTGKEILYVGFDGDIVEQWERASERPPRDAQG